MPFPFFGNVDQAASPDDLVAGDGDLNAPLPSFQRRRRSVRKRQDPIGARLEPGGRSRNVFEDGRVKPEPVTRGSMRQLACLELGKTGSRVGFGKQVAHPPRRTPAGDLHDPLFGTGGDISLKGHEPYVPVRSVQVRAQQLVIARLACRLPDEPMARIGIGVHAGQREPVVGQRHTSVGQSGLSNIRHRSPSRGEPFHIAGPGTRCGPDNHTYHAGSQDCTNACRPHAALGWHR